MVSKSIHAIAPQFGRSVFICSKPIQVLHCASIIRHYQISETKLLVYTKGIEDNKGFRDFFEKSNLSTVFKTSEWLDTTFDVADKLKLVKFESLFIEDDRVSFYSLFAPLKTKWMILFEEGLGTYRGQYQFNMGRLRRLKWKAISIFSGSGFEFGSGRKTDFVMIQKPDLFRRLNPRTARKVLPFPGLLNEIWIELETWNDLVSQNLDFEVSSQDRICLILGTWGGAPGLESFIAPEQYDQLIFKPHPHDGVGSVESARKLPNSWIPAEVFVDYFAQHCAKLDVIHYSSSVAFYMKDLNENTVFYDLDSSSHLGDLLSQL